MSKARSRFVLIHMMQGNQSYKSELELSEVRERVMKAMNNKIAVLIPTLDNDDDVVEYVMNGNHYSGFFGWVESAIEIPKLVVAPN